MGFLVSPVAPILASPVPPASHATSRTGHIVPLSGCALKDPRAAWRAAQRRRQPAETATNEHRATDASVNSTWRTVGRHLSSRKSLQIRALGIRSRHLAPEGSGSAWRSRARPSDERSSARSAPASRPTPSYAWPATTRVGATTASKVPSPTWGTGSRTRRSATSCVSTESSRSRSASGNRPGRNSSGLTLDVLGAIDFTTVEVWTNSGLITFYLLFVMEVATRTVHLAGCSTNPDDT